ncbi:MAG: beta-galactosidase [Oleiphilaceae bacterium]|jgi:beta-galactosidase
MARLTNVLTRKRTNNLIVALLCLFFSSQLFAQDVDKVTTYKDVNGWKLQVNDQDFYVKGVVWGYSPRGQNYTYNLWGESDDFIKKVLDHDFGLMAKAGVTATRSFSIIPPEWVTYIYNKFDIMTVINPLMGRYGSNVGGVWRTFSDYSDPLTRETLKAEVLETVERFKDTPGVLMIALGNESNYGLSWSSFEIENLPVDEQNREKAKFLYSLYAEIITAGKEIDKNHLFTIVNGDLQYLDLIAEYLPHMDVLGTNVYRGIGFSDLWDRVKAEYDRPIVFLEFGSDAFNARSFAEDQGAQASYLKGQWQEMYNHSYGNSGAGNSIGGMVFEWRDEWWKFKQTDNLDVQDRNASWSNGGYEFDFVEGQNNMNEEWFGITRLGKINSDGVYEAEPRMALDVLTEIWSMDPYGSTQESVNQMISDVDMDLHSLKSDIRMLKSAKKESEIFSLTGGSFSGDFIVKGRDSDIEENGEDALTSSDGQMAFLDFAFQPTNRISGDFSLNVLGNVSQSDFEFRYGDRGAPVRVNVLSDNEFGITSAKDTAIDGRERVEIYDFQAKYEGDSADLLTFYHVPRYHWGDEGDFFGLLRETTDMEGQDIWNDKAPYGAEIIGKQSLEGLKLVFGPEIYWGANPKAMLKYEFGSGGNEYAVIVSEDLAEKTGASGGTEATVRQSRQLTLYAKTDLASGVSLELGGIMSGTEKINDEFDRIYRSNTLVVDEIDFKDTLGVKAKVSFDVLGTSRAYLAMNYAGLVADGGDPLREFGTELPYSALGNKRELEGGIMINMEPFTIFPRLLYRENVIDSNGTIDPTINGTTVNPGINPRNRDDDPFAVLDNRAGKSAEVYLTYDPTPATSFYDWNVDLLEDAYFAANIGFTRTYYDSATDAYTFFLEEFDTNASFANGLAEEDVWLLKSKMIFNPYTGYTFIANIEAGKQQSTGDPDRGAVDYYSLNAKVIIDKKHIISGYIEKDAFGQYDFHRQFNITYPVQLKLDYSMLLDEYKSELRSSKLGVKFLYRTLDEGSPEDDYDDGANSYQFEIGTYFVFNF